MKKVLSLVLALVLVLGMIPTFAVGTGADELKANGFISGNESGDLLVDQALTREQLAALTAELAGEKELAAIFEQPAVYADADEISPWAVPFVAYAQEMGWMNGIPQGTERVFKPMDVVTGPELAATLMNALGYTVDSAAKYATVIADAAALGIELPTGALTRGDAFEAMWVAVSEVPMNGSDVTLGVFLGRLEPATPVVTDLAVKSVSATNLREVFVEFNNEIDKDTLDKANFMIGTTAATSVTLQEDGMTVVAWFELANQSTYTLKISKIADVNKSEIKDFSQQFTVTDFAAPTVVGVEVVGNKKLIVTFSEPVTPATAQILSNYKINDLLFGAAVTVSGREVTIITANRLPVGTHKLTVSTNVVDFANFKLVANNTDFAVASDETKAALATVVSASQTKVVITLTKPVEGTFGLSATSGTPTVTDSKTTKDNQTWTLNFQKTSPLPLSGTEIKLTDVVDYYGNKGDITFNVIPTIDLVRPEVVGVTPKTQTTMEVEFTKAVMLPQNSNFTIKSVATTPVTVPVTNVVYAKNADNEDVLTKVIITGTFTAKDYTVEIAGVKDTTVQENVMVPYTATVTVADLTVPTVAAVRAVNPTGTTAGKIIVEFSEKVNAATALDKANYSYILVGTKPVSVGTAHTITLLADGKGVEITVPKNPTASAGDTISSVTIVNVTDEAGNKVAPTIVASGSFGTIPTANLALTAQAATAKNKVVITVPANINPASVTASDFRVEGSTSTTDHVYVINAEYAAADNKITLTLASDLSANARVNGKAATLYVVAGNLADIYGNKVALTNGVATVGVLADQIAPTAVKVASAVGNPTTAVIKVNISEVLADDSFDTDFIVLKLDGVLYVAPGVAYAVDGTEGPQVTFTVTTTADLTGKSYSVEYFKHNGVEDGATPTANPLATFSFTGTLQ